MKTKKNQIFATGKQNMKSKPAIVKAVIAPFLFSVLTVVWTLLMFSITGSYADTLVSGTISTNTTWALAGSPYIVTGNVYVKNATANSSATTLTIEAGTVVKFKSGTGLYVGSGTYFGALFARGISGKPITFTSDAATPAAGNWSGIFFDGEAAGTTSIFEYSVIEYGGYETYHSSNYRYNNIFCNNASPNFNYCTIKSSKNYGIYLTNSSAKITNSKIESNIGYGIYSDSSSKPTITNNTIDDPILVYPNGSINLHGNTYTDETLGVEIAGGNIESDTVWDDNIYIISGNVYVKNTTADSPAATLTIAAGTKVKFKSGTGLYVGSGTYFGALFAKGVSGKPITFTSDAVTPAAGDWRGIFFDGESDDTPSILEYSVIEYGGYETYHSSNYRYNNIFCNNASPNFNYCTIKSSKNYGIYLTNSSAKITNSKIESNIGYGIYSDSSSKPTVTNNTIDDPILVYPNGSANIHGNTYTDETLGVEIAGGNIESDTVWDEKLYIISGNVCVKNATADSSATTLTIAAGTVVKFKSGTGLYVGSGTYRGALFARGTSDKPITFTSDAATPAAGNWSGIFFDGEFDDTPSILEYSVIEYGGYETYHSSNYRYNNIFCNNASPTFNYCTIKSSSNHGIYLNDSSAKITNSKIENNTGYGIYADSSAKPTITNNTIDDPILVYPNGSANIHGNTYTDETLSVEIAGGNIESDTVWDEKLYIISGNVCVKNATADSSATTLTIAAGTVVKFKSGTGLYVGSGTYRGALFARGTSDKPITFTSDAATPAAGNWSGIFFDGEAAGTPSILEYSVIEYGGYETYHSSNYRYNNIFCNNASPTFNYCTIKSSSNHGMYLNDSSAKITNSKIENNTGYGIYADSSAKPTITNNTIDDPIKVYPNGSMSIHSNTYTDGTLGVEIAGGNIESDTVWDEKLYIISGNVYVKNATADSSATTLTIAAGTVVKFKSGTGLYVGSGTYRGALFARGTSDKPIRFTSDTASPAAGDWRGIFFDGESSDNTPSILEYSVIEYGGYETYHSSNYRYNNIFCNNASPTIKYCTIRSSSNYGIYLSGAGCNNAKIECNNFKDNICGLYSSSAQPTIANNNFLRNKNYGIYYSGSAASPLNAVNNWWNDANGPNTSSDKTGGSVNFTPWLSQVSNCIPEPPINLPPFAPKIPTPSDKAVNVADTVTLSWVSGDPDPWDTVTFDVFFGESADNLVKIADNITEKTTQKAGLALGKTYFWKVVARDNNGVATEGKAWQFITKGPSPDLVVSKLTWEPATQINYAQNVVFTATIKNIGEGPAVDPFYVNFMIDGVSIGSQRVSDVIFTNNSVDVKINWTAKTGKTKIEVIVDNTGIVTESDETNNTLVLDMPNVDAGEIPVISAIDVSEKQTSVTITWKTTLNTNSQVEYGKTTAYGLKTPLYSSMTTNHSVVITGLESGTTYHFRVLSSNGASNVASTDQTFTTISADLPPNLTVISFTASPSAQILTQYKISWHIQNSSLGDASGSWFDALYLSNDNNLSSDDILLGEFAKTNGLASGTEYQRTETVNIPNLPPDSYYVIFKADSKGTLNESDEIDNIVVQLVTVTTAKLMVVTPDIVNLNIVSGAESKGNLKISNISVADMNGITATVKDSPANITVQVTPPSLLKSLTSQTFGYIVKATDDSVAESEVTVIFRDSAGTEASVVFKVRVLPANPKLVTNPDYIKSGMLRGAERIIEFELSNTGGASANNLQILIPQASWLKLVSPERIASLNPGDKTIITLMLQPSENMVLGPYKGDILISGSNTNMRIGFTFTAVSDGKGNLKVITEDEFTYFAEDKPNLAGAKVVLKDAFTNTIIADGITDSNGVFESLNINEGRYDLEISAEKHSSYRSTIEIVPGDTKEIKAFMSRQLVTYKWTVEQTEIQDDYRIALEAEFETHVPAPVVVVEPRTLVAFISEGETTIVDVTVTNHGLIAAQGVNINFPESEEYYVEPLIKEIGVLPPMTSVVVPVGISLKQQRSSNKAKISGIGRTTSYGETIREASSNDYTFCDFLNGEVYSFYYCDDKIWKKSSFSIETIILPIDIGLCIVGKKLDSCISAASTVLGIDSGLIQDALDCISKDKEACISLSSSMLGIDPNFVECALGNTDKCITLSSSMLGIDSGFSEFMQGAIDGFKSLACEKLYLNPCQCMLIDIPSSDNFMDAARCALCGTSSTNIDEGISSGSGNSGSGGLSINFGGWNSYTGGASNISGPSPIENKIGCDPATKPDNRTVKTNNVETNSDNVQSDISRYGGKIVRYKVIGK